MTGVTKYTDKMALIICDRIANGESLKSICQDEDIPARSTVFKWLAENKTFSDMYARAREEQADTIFDEIIEIADDGRNDWMERRGEEDAGWVTNGENIQRAKLRIDAGKWMAAKLRPKKYGERQEIEHSGSVELTTKEQRDAAVAAATRADS